MTPSGPRLFIYDPDRRWSGAQSVSQHVLPVPPIEAYEQEAHWEIAGPDPARSADKIDNDFIPR
jgi:hypothetical protein